jgi:hypothetical protein
VKFARAQAHCVHELIRHVTMSVRATIGFAQQSPNIKTRNNSLCATCNNSTNMDLINEAIAAINLRHPENKVVYQEYADFFGVKRVTLSQRHQGCQVPREAKECNQQKLTLQQGDELVLYIEDLTRQGLLPTRDMVRNFASTIAHKRVSESWVTCFYHRNEHNLVLKWSTGIDAVRHAADSYYKYELYFH